MTNKESRDLVIMALCQELDRANGMYPDWPKDIITGAALVAEEAGELLQAAVDVGWHKKTDCYNNLIDEAIQTGAMAIRFLMEVSQSKIK